MEITKKLGQVQAELKAPKNLNNTFGKYKYRSAEGILEAAKPVLAKCGLTLNLSDEIVQIGERYYIKATATVMADDESLSATAYAREPLEKKGMDEPQVTGTASSYARKYALNGLFAIDDTKDPDSDEYRNESEARAAKQAKKPIEEAVDNFGKAFAKTLDTLGDKEGLVKDAIEVAAGQGNHYTMEQARKWMCQHYGYADDFAWDDVKDDQLDELCIALTTTK